MQQIANNAPEAALIGDFPAAVDDAVMESGEAHQNLPQTNGARPWVLTRIVARSVAR